MVVGIRARLPDLNSLSNGFSLIIRLLTLLGTRGDQHQSTGVDLAAPSGKAQGGLTF